MSEKNRPHGYDAESEYRQAKKGHILGVVDSEQDVEYREGTSDRPKYRKEKPIIEKFEKGIDVNSRVDVDQISDPNIEGNAPNPYNSNPEEVLLVKEAGELGEDAVDASVIGDEAMLEAARRVAELKAEGQPKKIRIIEKEEPRGNGENVFVGMEDFEEFGDEYQELPKQKSLRRSAVEEVGGQIFPKDRGRREGVRPPREAIKNRQNRNEENRKSKSYMEYMRDRFNFYREKIKRNKDASDFVKKNMRKLLKRENKEKPQDQL